ncbi:MAG: UDP-N-acetylmuramoyl-tripeptide--D-alanyl-D-alanine ligase [Thermaerobacterales bacterium]
MLFTIADAARSTGGEVRGAGPDTPLMGVVVDSRAVRPGDLFVALAGERADGHDYAAQAVDRGAAAVLGRRDRAEALAGMPSVAVEEPLAALGALAAWYRVRFNVPVVGVTGSVGKTTTKEMIAALLEQKAGPVLKSLGNYNNEIGLPLSVFAWRRDHAAAVFELAMRGPGEIRYLARMVRPQIGVVTMVGPTHLENLGSVEQIAAAKGELVACLPPDGTAVLNRDDPLVKKMGQTAPCRVVYYGMGAEAMIRGTDPRTEGRFEFSFELSTPDGRRRVRVPSPGLHLIHNALAACAVGWTLGLDLETCAAGLSRYRPAGPRLQPAVLGGITLLDDSYNAGPESSAAALAVLRQVGGHGRAIAVLADMLELGPLSEEAHRRLGRLAAEKSDLLLGYGEAMAHAVDDARRAGLPAQFCRHFTAKDDLIAHLLAELEPGDTVLVKGSRGMAMEEVVAALRRSGPGREGSGSACSK